MTACMQRPFGAEEAKKGWWASLTLPQKVGLVAAGAAAAVVLSAFLVKDKPVPTESGATQATPNRRRKRRVAKANPPYAVYRSEKKRKRYKHEPFGRIEDAVRHAERDAREKHEELVVYDEGKTGQGPHGAFVAMFRPNRATKSFATALASTKRKSRVRKPTCKAHPGVPSCRCSPPAKYARMGATSAKDYALPECWMYPISTPALVRNAASRFGQFKMNLPPDVRAKVARRIDAAKKKFGIGAYRAR